MTTSLVMEAVTLVDDVIHARFAKSVSILTFIMRSASMLNSTDLAF